ncbi:3-isopropylmalate dehydrogenase [Alkalihalobacillus sp. LMS39]|uniref:3-isopropylmalate dehydrogenase n=1 Tax=Alkalihalobacillus sp. LMS39 TaxID=2924032 RepID=UPI001FB3C271|nr:3-isopropylmalate dehydrogenase [Alkalihalobacillus sp. LMS39]UOE93352.1 3-isopropylmalate dehydrogenase [Alkalihalobacillus sp. LMS39]
MNKKITVLPGDGIGPEVVQSAVEVLDTIAKHFDHQFTYTYAKLGGVAIDEENTPLPEATVKACKESDGVLLGAVGGPKWDTLPGHLRPEKGLLGIRKQLNLFANLRPVTAHESLTDSSTLKQEVINGVDLMIVRELTGGLYFGDPSERCQKDGEEAAVDTLLYKRSEIERIVKQAFELAKVRRQKVTSVDKANVLESSRLWREVAEEIGTQYPDIELEHMLVDNAAMQLIRNPKQFDVVVTENMFGDILSDEASMLTGSLGMLPSASIGSGGPGLYEPIHGSAPDIAGQNKANPLATIASVAMMLKYSFGMVKEAEIIEEAISHVLNAGHRTGDISKQGDAILSTTEMTEKVVDAIDAIVTVKN